VLAPGGIDRGEGEERRVVVHPRGKIEGQLPPDRLDVLHGEQRVRLGTGMKIARHGRGLAVDVHADLPQPLAGRPVDSPPAHLDLAGEREAAVVQHPVDPAGHVEAGKIHARLVDGDVEVLEAGEAAAEAGDRHAGRFWSHLGRLRQDVPHVPLGHPGGAVLGFGERAALALLLEVEAARRELPLAGMAGGQQDLVVDAEHQDATRSQQAPQAPQPGQEGRRREVAEQRGHQDGVEALVAVEVRRVGRGDDAVDPEPTALELDATGVDVRDPDPFRRDVADHEPGDPAIAAREVEDLAHPAGIAETPGQDLAVGRPDLPARVEVHHQGLVEVLAPAIVEEAPHLVLFVDSEVHSVADGRAVAEGEQKGVGLLLGVDQRAVGHGRVL
jgi:hypothetical protein